eukprot:COSAG02_NODE_6246_length_3702_cov_6.692478_1_plen_272_part_00
MSHEKGVTVLYERVLSPAYDRLATHIPRSITPNSITLLGGALCSVSFFLQQQGTPFGFGAGSVCFAAYCVLDNLDGKHARATGQTSDWGSVLDHAVDGVCSVPTCATATARFLGIPAFPACRLAMTCFFGMHVIEAATGKLYLGSDYYGADEVGIQVTIQLLLEALGYSSVLTTIFKVDGVEHNSAAMMAFLQGCLVLWQVSLLFQPTKRGFSCKQFAIWVPFYLGMLLLPEEFFSGIATYYACYVVPTLAAILFNSGAVAHYGDKGHARR